MQRSLIVFLLPIVAWTQAPDVPSTKQNIQAIHDLSKGGEKALPTLVPYLTGHDRETRLEAVKAIVKIDTLASLDPLLIALKDVDAEMQFRAMDGIVNAYVPGYVTHGVGGYFTKGVRQVKQIFSVQNDTVVDPDVTIRPDIAPALSEKIENSPDMDVRSTAALSAGILRLRATVPALEQGLHAKSSDVIVECLVALQKIGDASAGPSVAFLARDLDDRVQDVALTTLGILHSTTSAEDIRYAFKNARNLRVQRSALQALALLALPADRPLFEQSLQQNDTQLRADSLEGLGRLRDPEDYPKMQAAFEEPNADWRVHYAGAFAMVLEGNNSVEDLSPLRVLVEGFSLSARSAVSAAYVSELAQKQDTRAALAKILTDAVKEQKIGILHALSQVNAPDSLRTIQLYTNDADKDVAFAAMRDMQIAKTRSAS